MESERATRTERAVRAFQEIAHASATSLDLHDLLGLMVDQALAVIHSEVSLLRLLDRAGEHLELQVARGVPEEVVRQVRFRPGEGLAGRLLLNGEPLRGLNLQQDPRATQRDLARRDGWRAFAAVPLQMHHQPIGVWFMIRRERKSFSDQDLALLSSFADYASAAVERNALLYAVVREKHESETVIQASAHGILVVDGRGWVVNMNPALERLTGWTLREARGQPCCDIVGCQFDEGGNDDVAPVVCPLDIEQFGDDRAFLEYQLTTRDGQRIPVETSYGLIRDDDGELTRVVMVFRDISHQRELNRMRAELIANVSHELRTPLSLIKGYATTLLSPDVALDESETRRFLNNVSAAADHLGRMIDDLLFASRIETQQLGLQLRRFDLGEIIHKTLRWFRPHAGDCELVADLPAEDLQVYADPDRVEQILVNLLSNAVKYSPGGGQVTVRARQVGDPPLAVIHVIDEGQGIAQKHLPRIFDRYYLTEDSRQGVGLGLYICRGLVEAMDGQIWVASEIGKGSTFSFSLPIEQEAC